MGGRFEQSSCILFSPLHISLREPVLRLTGLEPDIVAPAEPIIARKDRLDLAEDRKRLFALASKCVVIAEVDQRIGFCLKDTVFTRQLRAVLVVAARFVEALQLTIDPPDAVEYLWQSETVAVTLSQLNCLVHCLPEPAQGLIDRAAFLEESNIPLGLFLSGKLLD